MGILLYDGTEHGFEDRLLAHLKVVIVQKLRRNESFLLSWPIGQEEGGGRRSLWITDGVALTFQFNGSRSPALNRQWVEQMVIASHSMQGVNVADLPEPHDPAAAPAAS